jgi:hypothetical protein
MEKMEMDGWMGGCRIYGRLKTYCVTEIDTLLCFLPMGWGIHYILRLGIVLDLYISCHLYWS